MQKRGGCTRHTQGRTFPPPPEIKIIPLAGPNGTEKTDTSETPLLILSSQSFQQVSIVRNNELESRGRTASAGTEPQERRAAREPAHARSAGQDPIRNQAPPPDGRSQGTAVCHLPPSGLLEPPAKYHVRDFCCFWFFFFFIQEAAVWNKCQLGWGAGSQGRRDLGCG